MAERKQLVMNSNYILACQLTLSGKASKQIHHLSSESLQLWPARNLRELLTGFLIPSPQTSGSLSGRVVSTRCQCSPGLHLVGGTLVCLAENCSILSKLGITKCPGQIAQMSGHGTGPSLGLDQGCRHVQAFLIMAADKSVISGCSGKDDCTQLH